MKLIFHKNQALTSVDTNEHLWVVRNEQIAFNNYVKVYIKTVNVEKEFGWSQKAMGVFSTFISLL